MQQYKHITLNGLYGLLTTVFILLQVGVYANANTGIKITVDAAGKGNFSSIQAAINSLPDSSKEAAVIFIRNGVYNEKIFIRKHNIVLQGEDKNKTIITQAIARDEWRCTNDNDWGVATLNIDANDITLLDLTVTNSYGFDWKADVTIDCLKDTVTGKRKLTKNGHQMALRSFQCTRLKAVNCIFRAYAGDTVSPWNVEGGMFYFKDCVMEGGVDLYCPRGWAYAENCSFYAHSGTAAIWHDGSKYKDSKTVLKHCSFGGFDGFKLGRYHKDAQFYLIDCAFADNMADTPIYRVATSNTIQWGERIYYYNCHRPAGDYSWYKNNLTTAEGSPAPGDISPEWVFGGKWQPSQQF